MNICHFHLGSQLSGVGTYINTLTQFNLKHSYIISKTMLSKNSLQLSEKKNLFSVVINIINIFKFINMNNICVLHIHTLKALFISFFLYPYFKLNNIKLVYTGHGIRFNQLDSKLKRIMYFYIEKISLFFVDHIVYIRKYDFDVGINKFGYKKKSHYIVTQLSFPIKDYIPRKNNNFQVISVGSLIDIKDPFRFIKIASCVVKRCPDIHFKWVGLGDLEAECLDLTKRLGVSNNIKFIGGVDNVHVQNLLLASDLYLCTSKIETFPISFLESFCSGLHVLSVNIFGLKYEFGNAVTFGDNEFLINSIIQMFSDESCLKINSNNSSDTYLKNFSNPRNMYSNYKVLYDS